MVKKIDRFFDALMGSGEFRPEEIVSTSDWPSICCLVAVGFIVAYLWSF